jgi:hypothetical protein
MVALAFDKLSIQDLVPLISKEAVQRPDDSAQVETFWYGVDAVLALGRAIEVISTLEDEAETLGTVSDLAGLAPTEKIECDLTETVVSRHVGHGLPPASQGTAKVARRGGGRGNPASAGAP